MANESNETRAERRPRPKPRARAPGRAWTCFVCVVVIGTIACLSAARAEAPFWDRYGAARALLRASGDTALVHAERLLATDPHDFVGRWLRSAYLVTRDSVKAADAVARAAAEPGSAGDQLEAAGILVRWKRAQAWPLAYARARDAYLAAGRIADASRACLWRAFADEDSALAWARDAAEAETLARRSGDAAAIADVLIHRGTREGQSNAEKSIATLQEALELLAPRGPSYQLAFCHQFLGWSLKAAGRLKESGEQYDIAVRLSAGRRDTTQLLASLSGLAAVRRAQGAYDEAGGLLDRSLRLATSVGEPRGVVTAHHALGVFHAEAGHHLEAREHLSICVDRMEEAKLIPMNRAITLVTLGGVEASLGDFEAARRHLEQSLAMCRERQLKTQEPYVLLQLASLQRELGDLEQARSLAEQGLAAARAASERRVEPVLLSEQAKILNSLGEHSLALEAARRGRVLARAVEPRNLWRLGLDQAAALEGLGRRTEAIAAVESTVTLFTEIPDSLQLGEALVLHGALLMRAGRTAPAVESLERAHALSRALASPGRIADAELALGAAWVHAGKPAEAIALLERGLTWFEGVQSAVKASEERSRYHARWHDAYATLARAYGRTGQPRRAFATIERGRARELRRLFGLRGPALEHKVPSSLARSLRTVESRLVAAQADLLHQYQLPHDRRPAPGRLRRLESRVDSLRTRWADLHLQVQRAAPDLARASGVGPAVSVKQVQGALAPGERLLSFAVASDGTLLAEVTADRIRLHEIPLLEDSLARMVSVASASLRQDESAEGGVADALADALLGPCGLDRERAHRIYVLPDGPLHHLPFEALRISAQGGNRRYLIEESEVVYAASATLLMKERAAPSRSERVLVAFGDPEIGQGTEARLREGTSMMASLGPLPHARREVESLKPLFSGSRVFVGAEATEARFLEEASRAGILHVAAHAFADDRQPDFSGIVLASSSATAEKEDGLVQAYEVADRSFRVDLATLSACETGRGRLLRGEGLLGLARAFRIAGVRNLVVSLWKVDDAATADFMAEFYSRISQGLAPSAALRAAKLACIADLYRPVPPTGAAGAPGSSQRGVGARTRAERLGAPSSWAPFVLLGSR